MRGYQEVMAAKAYDLNIDWSGARAIAAGHNPYSPEGIKFMGAPQGAGLGHPPTTLVWLLPLSDLSLPAAKAVWNELTLLLLFVHLLLVATELELPSPLATVPLLVGLVLCASWMRNHLSLGQLSEWIAFLYALAWLHLRRGREAWAGALIGLACTLKWYPGAVVVLFLLARRYRFVLAASAAWLAVAIPVTARIGLVAWKQFLSQQREFVIQWMTDLRNASIEGFVQRLHYPACKFFHGPRQPWATGTYLATGLSLALAVLAWWLTRRPLREGRAIDLPFALLTLVSMVTGPWAWEHYNVLVILPLFVTLVALVRARRCGLGVAWTAAGALTLAAVVAMLAVNMNWKLELWSAWFGKGPPQPKPPHALLHFAEAISLLAAPALIVLISLLIRWSTKRAPDAFASLRLGAAVEVAAAEVAAAS
jgi:hypothetical protein